VLPQTNFLVKLSLLDYVEYVHSQTRSLRVAMDYGNMLVLLLIFLHASEDHPREMTRGVYKH
jgi:hypothetical protein